jgi:hypothetical protein
MHARWFFPGSGIETGETSSTIALCRDPQHAMEHISREHEPLKGQPRESLAALPWSPQGGESLGERHFIDLRQGLPQEGKRPSSASSWERWRGARKGCLAPIRHLHALPGSISDRPLRDFLSLPRLETLNAKRIPVIRGVWLELTVVNRPLQLHGPRRGKGEMGCRGSWRPRRVWGLLGTEQDCPNDPDFLLLRDCVVYFERWAVKCWLASDHCPSPAGDAVCIKQQPRTYRE